MTIVPKLARNVNFETIFVDGLEGPKTEKHVMISSQTDLTNFFDNNLPNAPIDIREGFIFAIGLGQRPTGGYSVKVRSIIQEIAGIMSGAVTLFYEEDLSQGPKQQMVTAPCVIVKTSDLKFATSITFQKVDSASNEGNPDFSKVESHFIVISLTGTTTGCKIVPEGSFYLAIYSKVFGPATQAECDEWVASNCQ